MYRLCEYLIFFLLMIMKNYPTYAKFFFLKPLRIFLQRKKRIGVLFFFSPTFSHHLFSCTAVLETNAGCLMKISYNQSLGKIFQPLVPSINLLYDYDLKIRTMRLMVELFSWKKIKWLNINYITLLQWTRTIPGPNVFLTHEILNSFRTLRRA